MSQWVDYDYFEDKSEADQIIDEAVEQLTGLISKRVKDDTEKVQKENSKLSDRNAELQKEIWELREQNDLLKLDLEATKQELERNDNKIPRVPFMPGDRIYFIGARDSVYIKCPKCGGNGKLKFQTIEYGEIKATCPQCKGIGEESYAPAIACDGYILRSRVTLDAMQDTPSFMYDLVSDIRDLNSIKNGGSVYTFSLKDVYKTEDEAQKVAISLTEQRKRFAEKRIFDTAETNKEKSL